MCRNLFHFRCPSFLSICISNLVSTCRDLINGVSLISNLVKVLVCLLNYKEPLMGNTTKIRLKMSCHNKVPIKDGN